MKFILTVYICSLLSGECVQKGLGESYSILFDGKLFKIDTVNTMELYPKFMCEKTDNPKAPEESASAT